MKARCRCGKPMDLLWAWDNAQQNVDDHAHNVWRCDGCGMLLQQRLWADRGATWVSREGIIMSSERVVVQMLLTAAAPGKAER